jgi:hypothetical protein
VRRDHPPGAFADGAGGTKENNAFAAGGHGDGGGRSSG